MKVEMKTQREVKDDLVSCESEADGAMEITTSPAVVNNKVSRVTTRRGAELCRS